MIAQYKQEVLMDYERMSQVVLRRLEREYEEHEKSGAPFAFIGTDEAYASVVELYANPEPNWVGKRKDIAYLPGRVSMMNTCHLQDTLSSCGAKNASNQRVEEFRDLHLEIAISLG
jgi:hypothetical protein